MIKFKWDSSESDPIRSLREDIWIGTGEQVW